MAGALREVLARFGVSFDDKELKAGDKAVDGLVGKLTSLGGLLVGGAVIHGIKSFITDIVEQADAINDQAKVLGVSTKELQAWQYAAKLSGIEAGEMTGALGKFNKNVAEAGKGTGPAADAFRSLGVNVKDASGKLGQPIDLLEGIAGGLAKIENPAERTNALMSLFGKSGAKLGPLFAEGAEGIAKLKAEFEDLGGGFSDDFIQSAAEMDDAVDRLSFSWLSFKARFAGLVLPTIQYFITIATKATVAIGKWTDKIGLMGKGSNLAAAAAVTLGTAFLVAGLKAIAPWLPMLATFAAIILIVDELITLWQGGDTLIGRAIDAVFGAGTQKQVTQWLQDVVKSTIDFFSNTTRGWSEFKAGIELIWFDLVNAFTSTWAGAALETLISNAFKQITTAVDISAAAFRVLASVFDTVATAIGPVLTGIGKLVEFGTKGQLSVVGAILGKLAPSKDPNAIAQQRQAIVDSSVPTASVPVSNSNSMVNGPTTINVTVPPGTPAQQANAIGSAVKKAVEPSNKAMFNSLVKTGG